jgi:hypothetical protein
MKYLLEQAITIVTQKEEKIKTEGKSCIQEEQTEIPCACAQGGQLARCKGF